MRKCKECNSIFKLAIISIIIIYLSINCSAEETTPKPKNKSKTVTVKAKPKTKAVSAKAKPETKAITAKPKKEVEAAKTEAEAEAAKAKQQSKVVTTKAKEKSRAVSAILKSEKNKTHQKNISEIVKSLDNTYSDLYEKLINNGKIVIFFDPAHGKLSNGKWQGAMTHRLSCTNKPEEYYSILISRKLYGLLKKNKYLKVETTSDFMKVLKNESETYNNIPFSKTVKMAKNARAFIIISEHLNNVSVLKKAGGKVNIPGIHITRDKFRRKMLKYVKGSHSGFLTLYNELDASGFSKNYALLLKEKLEDEGLKANSWEFGAVADDRFSYFTDFPISVIYESGFISNPEEEQKLRDDNYLSTLATAQYDALIETIEEYFGIDISGNDVSKSFKLNDTRNDLIQLSRLATYYIKKGNARKGISIIREMEKKYSKTKINDNIKYFSKIKKIIHRSEKYYRLGKKYARKKHYRKSHRYYRKARRIVAGVPLLSTFYAKYYKKTHGKKFKSKKHKIHNIVENTKPYPITTKKASLYTKIILPIEEDQNLEQAIKIALQPDDKTLKKLTNKLRKYRIVKWRKARKYSKKKGRRITYWKKIVRSVKFHTGIYVVNFGKNLKVKRINRVSRVHLNPYKYQNQQYLKNSHFATGEKHKSL